MAGTPVSAGPFVGGLNTLSDPGAIADEELVVCQNFEVDPDGALKTRPPFVDYSATMFSGTGMRFLGYFVNAAGVQSAIASSGAGTFYLSGNAWVSITSSQATAITQFLGLLYLLMPTGGPSSGTWDGVTYTADATMPKGSSIVAYKGRLWVATTGSTVQYSANVRDSNFWTVGSTYGGTLAVSSGDGQRNVALLILSNVLLIFRDRSIWQFSFSSDPIYGAQTVLVPDVGLASPDALVVFEGIAYFMFDGKAYVLNGSNAQQLNTNVPFVATLRTGVYLPFSVSAVGRRIIFSYYDTMYVFNLRSRTWTTWTSPSLLGIGKILQVSGALAGDNAVYIAHSNFTPTIGAQGTLKFTDGYSSDKEATFQAIMQTKTYDYATPLNMKRLFYWALDVIFKSDLQATVVPELFSSRVTWGQLRRSGVTWGRELNFTWGQPAVASAGTTTTVAPVQGGSAPSRKVLKLNGALHSRRMRYRVVIPVDGSLTTSPAKIFGLETTVAVKALVSKRVS